jgi:octopine/nopaline transport system permease protein
MEVFICAAAIYLVLNFIIVRALGMLEKKLSPHLRDRNDTAPKKRSSSATLKAATVPDSQHIDS